VATLTGDAILAVTDPYRAFAIGVAAIEANPILIWRVHAVGPGL
jgi:hypothetical protein